jgi:hypothetical protein
MTTAYSNTNPGGSALTCAATFILVSLSNGLGAPSAGVDEVVLLLAMPGRGRRTDPCDRVDRRRIVTAGRSLMATLRAVSDMLGRAGSSSALLSSSASTHDESFRRSSGTSGGKRRRGVHRTPSVSARAVSLARPPGAEAVKRNTVPGDTQASSGHSLLAA